MPKVKISPIEQKEKLLEQIKELETKIAQVDKVRVTKIAELAKRHRLIDLTDEILEKEFKAICEKYKKEQKAESLTSPNLEDSKKNS